MNGLTLVKYALALLGLALVLAADSMGRRWVGYSGLGLIAAAFLLRFVSARNRPSPPPSSQEEP